MKKLFIITLLLLSSLNNRSFCQSWSGLGATWYYGSIGLTSEGYVKIENMGDTIIAGKLTDVLEKTAVYYDFPTQTYYTSMFGREFIYYENDIVYFHRNGQFHTLYNFNAQPGEKWLIPANDICESDSVIVDSVTTVIINGFSLRRLFVHTTSDQFFFSNELTEKIGASGYMLPEPSCVPDLDEGGGLRCFQDSGFYYNIAENNDCDYITAAFSEKANSVKDKIFPNPSSGTFYFNSKSNFLSVNVYDLLGHLLYKSELKANSVDLNHLSAGCYLLQLQSREGTTVHEVSIVR